MFEELLECVLKTLEKNGKSIHTDCILDVASKALISRTSREERITVANIVSEKDAFTFRNRARWREGFQKLHALNETALQAGMVFREQWIQHPKFVNDPLLGVLMRQHAHACRISGEIIHLLEGGYPDAALARWRTLYEIVVVCMFIQKYGKDAAEDYIKHGMVKTVEGMNEHKRTAEAMKSASFTDDELKNANTLKEQITDGDSGWHWARKYAGFSKFEKIREHVGMGKWSHNYKLASRNIHADYFEMKSMLAMSECDDDVLLVAQSNSGMTLPAQFTAISLTQITTVFITTYSNEPESVLSYLLDSLIKCNSTHREMKVSYDSHGTTFIPGRIEKHTWHFIRSSPAFNDIRLKRS